MIRTVVWFGVGGFFTACYANLVRGLPMWRSRYLYRMFPLVVFLVLVYCIDRACDHRFSSYQFWSKCQERSKVISS